MRLCFTFNQKTLLFCSFLNMSLAVLRKYFCVGIMLVRFIFILLFLFYNVGILVRLENYSWHLENTVNVTKKQSSKCPWISHFWVKFSGNLIMTRGIFLETCFSVSGADFFCWVGDLVKFMWNLCINKCNRLKIEKWTQFRFSQTHNDHHQPASISQSTQNCLQTVTTNENLNQPTNPLYSTNS